MQTKLSLLLAFTLSLYSTVIFSQTIVHVTSCNMNGWVKQELNNSTVSFTNGPSTPPIQNGSVQFNCPVTAPTGQFGRMRNTQYAGTLLSSLTALSYSTYVQQAESIFDTPFLVLAIDNDGNGTVDNPIVFVPKYQSGSYITQAQLPDQGSIQTNIWQTWDALHGGWWTGPTVDPEHGGRVYKLSTYISEHPNARIMNETTGGGVRLTAGGRAFANNFIGNADAFTIGVNGNTKIYNFELGIDAGPDRTVIYGYGSNCTTLSASTNAGTPPYQYTWSTNSVVLYGQNVQVCPTVSTTYTLTVTDANSCTRTDNVSIFVNDVRCGNNNDKVMMCHNGQEICVARQAVPAILASGGTLGKCTLTSAPMVDMIQKAPVDVPLNFKVSSYPNPVSDVSRIEYHLPVDCRVFITVFDREGRVVKKYAAIDNSAGIYKVNFDAAKLHSGMYYCNIVAVSQNRSWSLTNKITVLH